MSDRTIRIVTILAMVGSFFCGYLAQITTSDRKAAWEAHEWAEQRKHERSELGAGKCHDEIITAEAAYNPCTHPEHRIVANWDGTRFLCRCCASLSLQECGVRP